MKSIFDKKLYLKLTLLLIPFLVLVIEFISYGLIRYKKSSFPERSYIKYEHLRPDMINGIRFKEPKNSKDKKNIYINKYGLAKTFYESDATDFNENKGIIITGNSVSLGHPFIERGLFKKTFMNLIEKGIRDKGGLFDIVNLSFYNFNSWEEKVELNRYLNSFYNYKDLPNVDIFASVGGIQDFWGFIDLLHNKTYLERDYYKANGLMTWKQRNKPFENFYQKSYNSSMGNILISLDILFNSFISFIKENSNTVEIMRRTRDKKSNELIYENIEKYDFIKISNEESLLKNIIENKLGITNEEYKYIKDSSIKSTTRNLRAISVVIPRSKVFFVYLPTRITIKEQINISNRFKYKNLNIKDLHIIEKDYRNSLIINLSQIKNIDIINIGSIGKFDWFTDESHFSIKGHEKIAEILQPYFLNALNNEK